MVFAFRIRDLSEVRSFAETVSDMNGVLARCSGLSLRASSMFHVFAGHCFADALLAVALLVFFEVRASVATMAWIDSNSAFSGLIASSARSGAHVPRFPGRYLAVDRAVVGIAFTGLGKGLQFEVPYTSIFELRAHCATSPAFMDLFSGTSLGTAFTTRAAACSPSTP